MESEETNEDKKPKLLKIPLSVYISEGNKYLKLHLLDKAIASFNAALEQSPGDSKLLKCRAKCYIRQGRYAEAKKDAGSILSSNPKSTEGMMLLAEVYYLLGDLEKSFLMYYNCHEIRPNSKPLKLGYQLCESDIDNALGEDSYLVIDEKAIEDLRTVPIGKYRAISSKKTIKEDKYTSDINCVNRWLIDESMKSVHPQCHYLLQYMKSCQMC